MRADRLAAYATLGLGVEASEDEIKSAWKSKAKALHPDAGGDAAGFDRALKAYKLLLTEWEPSELPGWRYDINNPIYDPPFAGSYGPYRNREEWHRRNSARLRRADGSRRPSFHVKEYVFWWRYAELKAYEKEFRARDARHSHARTVARNPYYRAVSALERVTYWLAALLLCGLGSYARISGLTYRIVRPGIGQSILWGKWLGVPRIVADTPFHMTGVVIGNLLAAVVIGSLWALRSSRGRFSTIEQRGVGTVVVLLTLGGEFIVVGKVTLPLVLLAVTAVYLRYAGYFRVPNFISRIRGRGKNK